jgi:hypothetical protein
MTEVIYEVIIFIREEALEQNSGFPAQSSIITQNLHRGIK